MANREDSEQTPDPAASDLSLHCLRLIWVYTVCLSHSVRICKVMMRVNIIVMVIWDCKDSMKIWQLITFISSKLAASCENVPYGICGQRSLRSARASTQSDQSLHCPLTELLDTIECFNCKQMSGWDFAHAQGGVYLYFWACSKELFRLARPKYGQNVIVRRISRNVWY